MEWPLLAMVPGEERDRVLRATRVRRFARGEVLVHQGDPADSLHLVESGRVAVKVSTAQGQPAILNLLGPGDFFGELSLLGSRAPRRSASVVALEATTTRSLSAAAFRELRRTSPAAVDLLLAMLAERVEELSDRLVEVMYDSLDTRVHRRLLDLARAYGTGDGPVVVPITQEALAELVGGTRPSVNQALQRLARRGVVELGRGRLEVRDPQWLARRVG